MWERLHFFAHHSLTPAVLALCIALIFLTYYTKKLRRYGGEDVSPHPSKPRTFYIIQSVWMALCTHRWKVSLPYLYSELDIFSIQFWVFWDKIQHPMPFIPPLFNLISRRTKGVATRRLHTEPKWGTQLRRMQEVLWKRAGQSYWFCLLPLEPFQCVSTSH